MASFSSSFSGAVGGFSVDATGNSGLHRLKNAEKPWWEKPQKRIFDPPTPRPTEAPVEIVDEIVEAVDDIPQYIKEKIDVVAETHIYGDIKQTLQSALALNDITYQVEYLSYLKKRQIAIEEQRSAERMKMIILLLLS